MCQSAKINAVQSTSHAVILFILYIMRFSAQESMFYIFSQRTRVKL